MRCCVIGVVQRILTVIPGLPFHFRNSGYLLIRQDCTLWSCGEVRQQDIATLNPMTS